MIPGLRGLILSTATPLPLVRAAFETPPPVTLTLAPLTRFLPAVTLAVTLSGFPSALIIFGETVSVRHTSGFGTGFTVGGLSGAGTTVTAESTLSAGLVSRPPPPVTVAVFVCVPTAVARPVIAIVTVWPAAMEPRLQVMSDGLRLHVPCDGFAVR